MTEKQPKCPECGESGLKTIGAATMTCASCGYVGKFNDFYQPDKQPNEKQGIINGLAHSKRIIEYETGNIDRLKAELVRYLPGYIEPGTVMVYGGKRTDQWGRIEIVKQCVVDDGNGWVIEHTYGRGVFPDDSYSVRLPIRFIDHYHPEEVPSG